MKNSRLSYTLLGLSLLITAPTTVEASPYGTCQLLLTFVIALSGVTCPTQTPEENLSPLLFNQEQQLQFSSFNEELLNPTTLILPQSQTEADLSQEIKKPPSDMKTLYFERRSLQDADDVVCDCQCGGGDILDILTFVFLIQVHIASGCILYKVKRDYAIPIEVTSKGKPTQEAVIDTKPNIIELT